MLSVKDNTWCSLPPVGFNFDGIIHGHLLCASSSGRCFISNGDSIVQGALSIWDDEMSVDVDGIDWFCTVLGEREGSCLSL